jgi:hypothetical protein
MARMLASPIVERFLKDIFGQIPEHGFLKVNNRIKCDLRGSWAAR